MNNTTLVLSVIALVLALAGTVAIHILVLPGSRRPYLSPILRKMADFFNLRTLFLEKILKALYVFLNLVIVLGAIVCLFTVREIGVPVGILTLLLGPVLLRLFHESIMLRLLQVKNLQEINRRLAGQEDAAAPVPAAQAPEAPQAEEAQPRRHRSGRAAERTGAAPQAYPDYAQAQPRQYPQDRPQPGAPAPYSEYAPQPRQPSQQQPSYQQTSYGAYQQPYYGGAYPQDTGRQQR